MNKMTVRDIGVSGKRVLVRVDFNVPFDIKTGEITDDSRIRAAIPTINYLIEHDARIIVMSHLGRPKGKVVEDMRLTPVAQRFSKIVGKQVTTTEDCIGPEVYASAARVLNCHVFGGILRSGIQTIRRASPLRSRCAAAPK